MQRIYSKKFVKEAKKLRKKYRTIDRDIQKFVELIRDEKVIAVTRIQNVGDLEIYKARLRNSASDSGKSGGFRIVYYLNMKDCCYFLSIYAKSQKSDISKGEILQILKDENLIL